MPAAQGYIGRNPADSSTVIARQSFSPTGIQTDFTFAAGYEVGYVDLYLNGARLVEGQDFTATNGSTVGLTTNAVNGDVLEVVAFKAFNAANVTNAGGNFTVGNNLTVSGTSAFTGAITATGGVVGDVTGDVTGDATGLSGTPDLTIRNITGVAATFTGILSYDDVVNVDSIGIITARSIVSIADSIIHTGDTDTSIRFPSAGTFTINTDGSEKVRVTSDGEALIGATSARVVEWSPGNGGTPKLQVEGNAGSSSQILITDTRTDGRNSQLAFAKTRDGSIVQDDDILGSIGFFGDDGSDTRTWGGRITCEVDGTPGGNDMPGRLAFFTTADGSGTPTERVRIDSSGRMGLGSVAPEDPLHIKSNSGSIRLENTVVSNNDSTIAYDNDTFHIKVDPNNVRGSSAFKLDIDTFTALTVDDNRRLGVNTESPTSVFDVQVNTLAGINFTNSGQSPLLDFRANNVETAGRIRVAEASGGGAMLFLTKTTGDTLTESFRIDTSQRVLIGTTSNVGSSSVLQVREDGFGRNLEIFRSYDSANTPARIRFSNSRGTAASPTIVVDGDDLGEIRFNGHDGTNYDTPAAAIFGVVDGTPGENDMPGRLEFHTTADGGSSTTERLRITSVGHVSIVGDSKKLLIGAGDDLEIYHDGTNSVIDNNTGDLNITTTGSGDDIYLDAADDIYLRVAGNENAIVCSDNGNVALYFNNVQVFQTYSEGIKVIGDEGSSAGIRLEADQGDDNGDTWRINSNQDVNDLTISNDTSGSLVDKLTLTTGGDLTATGNVTAYSDISLKENIETIPNALDKVLNLRGVEFDRTDTPEEQHQIGVIAQEVEEIVPEVVITHKDGLKSVAYGNLVGLLIESIKELKAEVNDLKAQLEG